MSPYKNNYIVLLAILLFAGYQGFSQSGRATVKVLSRVQQDRILLRWSPDQPLAWKKANKYGYAVERYTIVRNGQILAVPEKKALVAAPFKPEPLAQWETIANRSDQAAVMAQALYGDSFEVSSGEDKNSPAAVVAMSEELEQRFGFALYAADLDFEAAQKAALGFVDTDVKKGEKYLYKVYALIPSRELAVDSGGVYVSLDEYEALPKPQGLVAVAGNKTAMLSWNYDLLRSYYNSYTVERSENGRDFSQLGGLPVTNLNDKEGKKAASMYYIDTLAVNGKKYTYRISGINAFGEKGPVSDTVTVSGQELLAYVPFITANNIPTDHEVEIQWEFEQEGEPLLKEFTINVSDKADGTYQPVVKGIRPGERKAVYKRKEPLEGAYYFTVTAVPLTGTLRTSFPVLVQTVDSVPPAAPVGLKGTIDSVGIVRLSWKSNMEKDIYGYRVYRAAQQKEEFSGITQEIILTNSFMDTVQVRSLNDKAYYKIVAVDKRYNNSVFSEAITLQKPDFLPPAPAVITGYEINDKAVLISWEKSSSTDAVRYALFRSDAADTSKMLEVAQCSDSLLQTPFRDEKAAPGKPYSYFITTYDKSGLKSNSVQRLNISMSNASLLIKPGVKGLDVFKDQSAKYLDLFWSYDQHGISDFLVYRAENGAPLTLWKTIPANAFTIRDPDVRPGKPYEYAVRAQFSDGTLSKFSKIKITF